MKYTKITILLAIGFFIGYLVARLDKPRPYVIGNLFLTHTVQCTVKNSTLVDCKFNIGDDLDSAANEWYNSYVNDVNTESDER